MQNPFRYARGGDAKQMMETAFRHAALAAKRAKVEGYIAEKAAQKEGVRIKTVGTILNGELKAVANSWPQFYKMDAIHRELAEVLIGSYRIRKSVEFCKWTANQIKDLQMISLKRLDHIRTTFDARNIRQYYYGRTSAYMKRCGRELKLLTDASKLLHNVPDIQRMPTVIIAGLPNVGKSSLLKAITGSSPEISPWQFTTKGLMLGYIEFGFHKVQFVDTPGLLDRPESKRNPIEKQAVTVLKLLADMVIYVFDPSETCGYSVEQQVRQYNEMKKTFNKPIIAVANKIDIVGSKQPEEIGVQTLPVSCDTGEGIDALKKLVKEKIKP